MHQNAWAAREGFGEPFFSEVVFLACWHIWLQRNSKVFISASPLLQYGAATLFMVSLC